jgi:thioredoxin 1
MVWPLPYGRPLGRRDVERIRGKAIIGKLDVDSNPNVTVKYGIRNIPALLYFKGGEVVDRQVGAVPKNILSAKLDAQLA